MFQAIYDSGWHHPGICWGAGLVVLALLARRLMSARGGGFALKALLVFQLAIMVDALFTGALTPLDPKSGLSTTLAIVFVVLGDMRFFVLFERYRVEAPERNRWRPLQLVRILALSLLIPVGSLPARWLWPGNGRALFLTYELMFAALALLFALWMVPKVKDDTARGWLRKLSWFEVVQYLAWASADILILSGVEEGLLFRLVPNTIYYALFVPFALLSMPERDDW